MPDTLTANYNLVKPEISGSVSTWGNKLNSNFDIIDAALDAANDLASAAMPKSGGVFTGPVKGPVATVDADLVRFDMLKAFIMNASPIGSQIIWGGSIASIPANWALCDGSTVGGVTTPDLRNRFIIGAGSTYAPGAFGGTTTHDHSGVTGSTVLSVSQMPSHTHTVSDSGHTHNISDPGHTHLYLTGGAEGNYGNGPDDKMSDPNTFGTTLTGYTGITVAANIAGISLLFNGGNLGHTHTIASANHLPPFYAQAIIMRYKYPWDP